jgi:hypothetical protein
MSTDVPDHKVECGGCGTDITGRPAGLPCDACGDTRRRHLVHLHESVTARDSLSIGVEYVEGRPWQEMWVRVQQRFAELLRHVTTVGGSIDDARQAASDFFIWCFHLKDWLKRDTAVPPATRNAVEDYLKHSTALRLCQDFANTDKHYTRNPGQRTAWIGGATGGDSQPVSLRVDFCEPNGMIGSRDALDLARKAMQEWEQFLSSHRLS